MSDINEMNLGPRWYVAHTYSGYENKVKTNLEKIVENRGLGHLIFEVQIPVDRELERENGEEREVEVKKFPSYVLVKMIMTDESWHVVRNIRGVTGFVGPGSKPIPLTDEEVEALCVENREIKLGYTLGDRVVISSGIFEGYNGTVQEISEDKKTVTVLVSMGRREMPVKLTSLDIKKDEQ